MEINLSEKNTNQSKPNPFKELIKNKKAFYSVLIFLLITAIAATAFVVIRARNKSSDSISDLPKESNQNTITPTPEPTKPKVVESPINGVILPEAEYLAIKDRPVLAVMVQNNSASRPEYGLNKADVVYETIAESGITRFMAVYWSEGDDGQVRSIRSARRYYVDLLGDYNDPVYMHEGYASGARNVSAIDAIYEYGIKSLGFGSGALMRDEECQLYRNTEHCAYSTTELMWELAKQSEWAGNADNIQKWKFKDNGDQVKFNGSNLKDFSINFSGFESYEYSVNWKYNNSTKKYERFNFDGTPYTTDGETEQVTKDVIVYQHIYSAYSGDDKGHLIQEVIGEGTGYIMQEGKVYNIKWSKPDFATRTKFYDAATGEEFIFNRGKIWVNLISSDIEYTNNDPILTLTISPTVAN